MNGDPIAVLNYGAGIAAGHLGRACWQGGLAIAAVWSACQVFSRWPPGLRCWLWRLAYLKLLTALVWSAPVALPLLPAPPAPDAGRRSPMMVNTPRSGVRSPQEQCVIVPHRSSSGIIPPAARHEDRGDVAAGASPRKELPRAVTWVMLFWLVGAGWYAAQTAREWRVGRCLIRGGSLIREAALSECCAGLCGRFGLRRAPQLLASEAAGSPMVVGVSRPVVFFSPSLLETYSEAEIRWLLAHELAHLKRRDLQWAWLPTAAGWLFFFHPLVWLAGREWRLAQEVACDELAVRMTGAPAREYGQVVLKIAARRRTPTYGEAAVVSAAGAYQSLRRRLIALQQIRPVPARHRRQISALLSVIGAMVVVPWQVTARAAFPEPQPLSRPQDRGQEAGAGEGRPPAVAGGRGPVPGRRRMVLDHQRHLAEQEHLRRLETLAHERRLADLEHQRRLATLAHERRLAEREQALRAAADAHQQREAVAEQWRLTEKLAHERRLAEEEQARRQAEQLHEQRLAARETARFLDQKLHSQVHEAHALQQQMTVQQWQIARTQRMIRSLSLQLRELQMEQRALGAKRQRLEMMTLRRHLMERAARDRLQRFRSRLASPRSGDRKSSP